VRAVNLIPSDQRPGAGGTYGRSGGAAYALVALACGLVGMSVLWLMARNDQANANAQVAQITAQAQQAQNEATALAAYNSFVSTSTARVTGIEQLAQDRFDWAHAFHELGRVLPYDVTLQSVTGTIAISTDSSSSPSPPAGATGATGATGSGGAAASNVTSASPAGGVPTLELTGCTTSQAEVAYTLQRLALIDGVTNVTLGTSTLAQVSGGAASTTACNATFTVNITFTALPTVSPTAATGASPSAGAIVASTPTVPSTSVASAPVSASASTTGPSGPSGAASATNTALKQAGSGAQ